MMALSLSYFHLVYRRHFGHTFFLGAHVAEDDRNAIPAYFSHFYLLGAIFQLMKRDDRLQRSPAASHFSAPIAACLKPL